MALTRNDKLLILAAVLLAGAVVGALAWWRTAGKLPEPPAATQPAPVEQKVEAPADAKPAVTAPVGSAAPAPAAQAPAPQQPAPLPVPHPEPDKTLSELFASDTQAPPVPPAAQAPALPEAAPAPAAPLPPPVVSAQPAPPPAPEKKKPETPAERKARQAAERKAAAEARRRAQEELRKAEAELKRVQAEKKKQQAQPKPAPEAAKPAVQEQPAQAPAQPRSEAPQKEPEAQPRPQAKAQPGPERRVVEKLTAVAAGNEVVFTLAGASTSGHAEAMLLSGPSRLVVDLPGEWTYRVTEKPAPDIVKAVRVGRHPDKLRLVLDLAETFKSGKRPAVEKTPEGLVIRLAR